MAVDCPYIRWIFGPFCLLMVVIPLEASAQQDTLDQTLPDTVDRSSDSLTVEESEAGDSSITGEERRLEPEAVDESELRAVARVLVAIDELRQAYYTRQGIPQDTAAGMQRNIYDEFTAEATQIIVEEGITVEFYSQVMAAARREPELRRRLIRMVQEVR